jgi:hypothetical protein
MPGTKAYAVSLLLGVSIALALAGPAVAAPTNSAQVVLPDPTSTVDGIPVALQYDDFYSYSARLLDTWQSGGLLGSNPTPSGGFLFSTGTGNLDLLIYTRSSGATNQNIGAGGAFDFEDPLVDPNNPTFSGTWGKGLNPNGPVTVGNLLAYLQATFNNATVPVLMFDQNQTGKSPDLQAKFKVSIIDPATMTEVATWTLDSTCQGPGGTAASPCGSGAIGFEAGTAHLPSIGSIDGFITSPGTITVTGASSTVYSVDNNIGSGKPDFFVFAPTMDLTLFNPSFWWVITGDLAALNDGGEELFLAGIKIEKCCPKVPNPGTLMLLGMGLAGLALLGSRRARLR